MKVGSMYVASKKDVYAVAERWLEKVYDSKQVSR